MLLDYLTMLLPPERVVRSRAFSSENVVLPPESPGTSSLMAARDELGDTTKPDKFTDNKRYFCFGQCFWSTSKESTKPSKLFGGFSDGYSCNPAVSLFLHAACWEETRYALRLAYKIKITCFPLIYGVNCLSKCPWNGWERKASLQVEHNYWVTYYDLIRSFRCFRNHIIYLILDTICHQYIWLVIPVTLLPDFA